MKKGIIPGFLVLAILAGFGGGYYFGKTNIPASPPAGVINATTGQPSGVDFSLFWQAWNTLESKYVDKSNLNQQKMIYGAVSGMVQSVGDPYTIYFPPSQSEAFKTDVTGQFQGVGMEIAIKNNQLTVVSPLEGTPAAKAGILSGDVITAINGTSTQGMSSDEAVSLIRGEKGTQVTLGILREGWSQPKDFTMTRDTIEIPSVNLDIRSDGVAYLQIYQFSESADAAFRDAATKILNSNANRIVLDLRNNPGGYLEVAQYIAGWFLDKGQTVAVEHFGDGSPDQVYKTDGPGSLSSYPMVVLINQGSASAAEILSGALRDDRGIQLIGVKSFGKGSVQTLTDLSEGSLKVTVAHWLTPKGNMINGIGLEPDVKVEITQDDINQGKDPQLDKALEVVKALQN